MLQGGSEGYKFWQSGSRGQVQTAERTCAQREGTSQVQQPPRHHHAAMDGRSNNRRLPTCMLAVPERLILLLLLLLRLRAASRQQECAVSLVVRVPFCKWPIFQGWLSGWVFRGCIRIVAHIWDCFNLLMKIQLWKKGLCVVYSWTRRITRVFARLVLKIQKFVCHYILT